MKKVLIRVSLAVTTLFVIQTGTFLTLGEAQLRKKLLSGYFQIPHDKDSAYVREDYARGTNEIRKYINAGLTDEQIIKEKLHVRHVFFHKEGDRSTEDSVALRDSGIAYYAWFSTGPVLFDFYKMQQTEYLIIDKKKCYGRDVVYQWFLFFWIKRFEIVRTSDATEEFSECFCTPDGHIRF